MGRNARLGVLCLMALAIGLARLVEVELDPGAPTPPPLAVAPPIEESPRVGRPGSPIAVRAAAPGSADAAPEDRGYVVQAGDTLGTISRKVYGSSRHWKRILEANRHILADPEKMRPGLRLRLPAPTAERQ